MRIPVFILLLLPPPFYGFQLPSPRNIINEVNSLENIVNTKAVVSSISSLTNTEIIQEDVLLDPLLVPSDFRLSTDIFYVILLLVSWYYRTSAVKDDTKLENLQIYSNTRRMTKVLFLIIVIILTKNVENAI